MVARGPVKPQVVGSNPTRGAKLSKRKGEEVFIFLAFFIEEFKIFFNLIILSFIGIFSVHFAPFSSSGGCCLSCQFPFLPKCCLLLFLAYFLTSSY